MQRIALYAFTLLVLGAFVPLACTQNFTQFENTGGSTGSNSSSTGSPTSSSSSSSSGGVCTNPATDCPAGNACVTYTCDAAHMCDAMNAQMGTKCANNGGTVCDGSGSCVACLMASDCPTPPNACTTATCNGEACGSNNAPMGTQCTGPNNEKVCDGNGNCIGCNTANDCTGSDSGDACTGGMCVAATCSDGVKDGMETDVDCGGPQCPPCTNSKDCAVNSDCKSGYCNSTCQPCQNDSNCSSGFYCKGNGGNAACTAQLTQGTACSGNDQCASGFCANGVCCNTSCDGCQVCTAALKGGGMDGVCGDAKANTDPNNFCQDQGAASCQHNGECDGNGNCADYPAGTSCGAASCNGGQMDGPKVCDGQGNCNPMSQMSCAPYSGCNGNMCATTCAHDPDCSTGNYCNTSTNKCTPQLTDGAVCTASDQCQSGHCPQGFCCMSACTGTCQSCGSSGSCGNAPVGTACATGFCNSAAMCVQCATDANCSAPTPACSPTGTCVQCSSTNMTQCTAGTPACNTTTGMCVQCTSNSNCSGTASTPVCDTTEDKCVQCVNNSTCTAPNGTCDTLMDADHDTCVECNANGDCTSNMCDTTTHMCM